MDKLSNAQMGQLLRQLLQADNSTLLRTGQGSPAAAQKSALAAGLTGGSLGAQLQIPPALRQILAQAQGPVGTLQALQQLQSQPELPPAVRTLVEQALAGSKQPVLNRATVSQWFGLNVAQALSQPMTPLTSSGSVSTGALWLQFALPLLLAGLKTPARGEGKAAPSPALANALTGLFGGAGLSQQLLRELQSSLQQVRLSQIQLADSMSRNEPDYYLSLPWQVGEEIRPIDLLLQRRKQQREQQEGEEAWLLSMRLQISRIGPVLARVRWDGNNAQIMIYTDNDAAARWLRPHLSQLESKLQAEGIAITSLAAQVGRIPATLAPDPNQLIRVKV